MVIFLDNSATTPLSDVAKQTIIEHLDDYGNPSSSYEFGRKSRLLIEDARERIAKCINAEPNEIFFTSGGSESNTWALNGHNAMSSSIEHHSIKTDYTVCFTDFKDGVIKPKDMDCKGWRNPDIISCMLVNNELGTIQPVKEMVEIAHNRGILFHTDAVQAVGHIPVDVKELDVDMLSASGHKFGALKGTGFLFVKNINRLNKLINGGKQEGGFRSGTENVLGIISMAAALEDAVEYMTERNNHIKILRDRLLSSLLKIEGACLNGSLENRIISNINIRFNGVSGSKLVALADLYNICISAGSACNEGNAQPSHVLKAIGLTDEEALSSIRITIGHQNTQEEIDYVANIITKLVERIRETS